MLLQVLNAVHLLLAESVCQCLLAPSQVLKSHQDDIKITFSADVPCKADIDLSTFDQ